MKWVNQLKEAMPDYAKDTKLNFICLLGIKTTEGPNPFYVIWVQLRVKMCNKSSNEEKRGGNG